MQEEIRKSKQPGADKIIKAHVTVVITATPLFVTFWLTITHKERDI